MKRKLILALFPLAILQLTACSSGPQMSTDVILTCTMFERPDEYRVQVLMNVAGGRTEPYEYIDMLVRELNYPDVEETLESKDLKDKFAKALYLYADSLTSNSESELRKSASANLDKVAAELKSRCEDLGMDYSQISE
jgi:hypothetical protein